MEFKGLYTTVIKKILRLQYYVLENTVQKFKTHLITEFSPSFHFLNMKKPVTVINSYVNISSPILKCV